MKNQTIENKKEFNKQPKLSKIKNEKLNNQNNE